MSFCVCGPERSSTISALQSSLTQRRLFKIMCWGFFFFFYSLNQFSHFSLLLAEWRPGTFLASLDCLPNGTIGYDPSPAVARDATKTFFPSSLVVTDGLAEITTRPCAIFFFSPPFSFPIFFFFLMFSSGEMESPRVCLPSCFFIWHTEALRLWNFNDSIVTNTADVIVWRSYCAVHWQTARHFTSIYPSWYKYGRTGKLPFPLFPEFASYKRGQREQDVIVWPEVLPL